MVIDNSVKAKYNECVTGRPDRDARWQGEVAGLHSACDDSLMAFADHSTKMAAVWWSDSRLGGQGSACTFACARIVMRASET